MFAFSRHNYYLQEKLRSTRTPEEQHASSDRGNTDVRQYFYDVYVKSAESRSIQNSHRVNRVKPAIPKVLKGITRQYLAYMTTS